jgi:hypothetical protein
MTSPLLRRTYGLGNSNVEGFKEPNMRWGLDKTPEARYRDDCTANKSDVGKMKLELFKKSKHT